MERVTIIRAASGWRSLDVKEIKEYKDLLYFMVLRDIRTLYAQTVLGFLWVILRPLIQIVLFTIVFGRLARIDTEGIPYFLFSAAAMVPWDYLSQSMSASSQSLIQEKHMLGKVYFPRLIFPITPVLSKLIDFGVSLIIVIPVMCYYGVHPTWKLLLLPIFVVLMAMLAVSAGLWLSAMAVRFRDVNHAIPFIVRILIYTAPVIYSASSIPFDLRILYSLNPIVSVIEGFRSCLLGLPIDWMHIVPGAFTTIILCFFGLVYFKQMEIIFADVI